MFDYTGPLSKVNEPRSREGARRFFGEAELARWDEPGWAKPEYQAPRSEPLKPLPEVARYSWNKKRAIKRERDRLGVKPGDQAILKLARPVHDPWRPAEQRLKFFAYATDRVKVVPYIYRPEVQRKAAKTRAKQREAASSNKFISRPEVQRGYLIGGRYRVQPRFTSYGSWGEDFTRDAGTLIEREDDKAQSTTCKILAENRTKVFCGTFTTPGGTPVAKHVMSCGSGYVVDRLTQWLNDRIVDGWYSYVWELNECGMPHLHILFRMDGSSDIPAFYSEARAEWTKILENVSDSSGVDLFERAEGGSWRGIENAVHVNFKLVTYGMAGYLAKYLSKNKSKDGRKNGWWPGRWWGVSKPLRLEVEKRRLNFILELDCGEQAKTIVEAICATGLSLFDRMICFPAKKEYAVDVYSFLAGCGAGKETAQAIIDWVVYGDVSALDVIREQRNTAAHAPP